jgi:hypothetical protein
MCAPLLHHPRPHVCKLAFRGDRNGQIADTSFNSGSEAIVTFSAGAAAYAVAIAKTGEIYLAGETTYSPCGPNCLPSCYCSSSFAVARLTSAGAIDNRFDYDGKLTTVFSTPCGPGGSKVNDAAITPDGKFTAAGTVENFWWFCGSSCGGSCCGSSATWYPDYDYQVNWDASWDRSDDWDVVYGRILGKPINSLPSILQQNSFEAGTDRQGKPIIVSNPLAKPRP